MKPTETIPGYADLFHADAMDVLRDMYDGDVDHVISDPPYHERTHKGARTNAPGAELVTKALVTFAAIGDEQFLELCEQCVRVAKRWVLLTCDWRHAAAAEHAGLPLIRLGVFLKPDACPQFTGDRPGTGWEAVMLLHRKGKKRWNGGGHHAVWTEHVQRGVSHPTAKPLALVRKWVRQFTDPGEVVLDPYMGSGTTCVAALKEGRKTMGVEIDAKYYAPAAERIRRACGRTEAGFY